MGRVGLPELLVILVLVIVIFGANRLPQLGQGIGSAIKNFKNAMGVPDEPTQLGACASCGTVNPPDSRFCGKCGKKL